MSQYERDFAAAGDAPLNTSELLALLTAVSAMPHSRRREAIACYLSASEGWHEALKALQGAFASDAATAVREGREKQDKHEINQRTSEYLQWPGLKAAGTSND